MARPDLLLIGSLLHDIGKGRDGDHSVVGAALAEQVGERLGLWPSDVALLSAMVRHHLLLPHTATRRDLDDPVTVARVLDTLGGDTLLLELLVALAEADALATGPGVWSDWKAQLVTDLGARCRAALAGRAPQGPDPLTDEQVRLAESGGVHVELDEGGGPGGGAFAVTVVAPDGPRLLSRAAGVLALHSLQVHSADLRSHRRAAVDVFGVSPVFGRPPDSALLRQELVRALDGSLLLADRLTAKERDYRSAGDGPAEPRAKILWFDDEASGAVVLELRTGDRIGLLYRVAAALEDAGVEVLWARVATLGSSVVDSFCLVGPDGAAELSSQQRRLVERAVLAVAR